MTKLPVTVIILTFNEEANISFALRSLKEFTDEVFIVDSFSMDKTLEIARQFTDKIYQNPWENWAVQRNWALDNLPISHEWIFFLDADEQVTPEFWRELEQKTGNGPENLAGINVRFDFYFLGCLLRFAYESPPVMRLIRQGRARWQGEGAREYAYVGGEVTTIESRLRHQDQKGLIEWVNKQTRNAAYEARLAKSRPSIGVQTRRTTTTAPVTERPWRRWLRYGVWDRLPRFWRSFAYFFYRYLFRGGFLDGKAGFAYCFLQALWLRILIDLLIEEQRQTN